METGDGQSGNGSLQPADIFNDALPLSPEERRSFLDRVCSGKPELRSEIESLLEIADRNPTFTRPPSEMPLPETLGRYVVVAERGRGGMGIVYEAVDPQLSRRVALKVLPEDLADDEEGLRRFQSEARLLASLDHESIATLHSLEEADGSHFFTMEFVDGHTLGEILRRGPLSVRDTLTLSVPILRALEHAHSQHIIHRDLKPANVMVREDMSVKVLDFGIAKALDVGPIPSADFPSSTQVVGSRLRGTRGYMSPEQLEGGGVDHRTDLWALGCVLYECLTGHPAFPITATLEDAAVPDLTALPRGTPAQVRALIASCLEIDPEERPDSAASIRQVIERVLKSQKSRVAMRVLYGVVALVAAAILTFFIVRERAAEEISLIEVHDGNTVHGIDESGEIIWRRTLPEPIQPNQPVDMVQPRRGARAPQTIVRGAETNLGVALMTYSPKSAIGTLWFLSSRDGQTLWSRRAEWQTPVNAQADLHYVWNGAIQWPGADTPVIATGLFDGDWYSTAVQFLTLQNNLLGEYYHPGHLWWFGEIDTDGDGTPSILLFGDNSSARFLQDLVPFDSRAHCGTVLLLDPPEVNGQAFPYSEGLPEHRDWPGMERAAERSYLLIPPLGPSSDANVLHVNLVNPSDGDGPPLVEAVLSDGRYLRLDAELKPQACYVGIASPAEAALSGKAQSVRVLYMREGEPTYLEVHLTF
jgi:hypothetical protein